MSETITPLLTRSAFSSEGLDCNDSFAIWSESVSPLFNSSIEGEKSSFFANIEAVDLDKLVIASTETSQQQFHRHQELTRKDQVDHLLLQLYTTGGVRGRNGHKKVSVEAGDIVLLDLSHEVHTQAETSHSISVIIPRDYWFHRSGKKAIPQGGLLKGNTVMGKILGDHIRSVWAATSKAQQHEAEGMSKALLSVTQHCMASMFGRHEKSDIAMKHATLSSIQRYIQRDLTSPSLSPEKICKAFNCSRSYLYRLFEPLGGVASQIQQQRLEKCYQSLIGANTEHLQISEIAFYWGFNNQSHFSRLFRKVYGISPKQARALRQDLTQQELKTVSNRNDKQDTPDYRQWLLGL